MKINKSLIPSLNEVFVITAAATTATDGTFTLTHEGNITAAIDHDAAAAAILAALEALPSIGAGDVTVVDAGGGLAANNGTATITFQGALAERAVALTGVFTGLTGNDHVLSNSVNGITNKLITLETENGDSQYLITSMILKMGSTGGVVTFKSDVTAISPAFEMVAADQLILPHNDAGWFEITAKGEDLNITLSAGDGDVQVTVKKVK